MTKMVQVTDKRGRTYSMPRRKSAEVSPGCNCARYKNSHLAEPGGMVGDEGYTLTAADIRIAQLEMTLRLIKEACADDDVKYIAEMADIMLRKSDN